MDRAVSYELPFQFAWYNENWIAGWMQRKTESGEGLCPIMVSFIKRDELEEHRRILGSIGLVSQRIELRSTALYRAVKPMLPIEDCLIIEHTDHEYLCSSFREGVLAAQHTLPKEWFHNEVGDVEFEETVPHNALLVIDAQCDAESTKRIQAALFACGMIVAGATLVTARELMEYHCPNATQETMAMADEFAVALGLALRDI